jgi:outer membrane protein, heavy metal efflux system
MDSIISAKWALCGTLAVCALLWAGQIAIRAQTAPSISLSRPVPLLKSGGPTAQEAASTDGLLPLAQLLELAVQNNPNLATSQALAAEARGKLIQVGLYPNPTISWRGNEMAAKDAGVGFQGMQIEQQIVTAHKLKINRAAARYEVSAADWLVVARWYQVMKQVRAAYYDVVAARRQIQIAAELVSLGKKALDVAETLQAKGAGTRPDVLRAKVELDQNRIQFVVAQERYQATRRVLAAAVGLPDLPPAPAGEPPLEEIPDYQWEPVLQNVLFRSADLQIARSLAGQAEQLLRRAQVEPIPNINFLTRPDYSAMDRRAVISVQVGVPVPLYNRNQGNIRAAQAAVVRTRQEVRSVELRLTEQVALAIQRYQTARKQVEEYERRIIPNAEESLRLVQRGYQSGDPKYDYTAVLQAQRVLAQVQLSYVQSFGELWKAVSDLAALLQQDRPESVGLPGN